MAGLLGEAHNDHDNARRSLGSRWPQSIITDFHPTIVMLALGCIAAGVVLFAVVAGGLGNADGRGWADRPVTVLLLLLGAAAYLQHRFYHKQLGAAWDRFKAEEPEAFKAASKKYLGLP